MADVNIKSKNQFGGITAQNVNSTVDQFNTTTASQPESRFRSIAWWIFGVAGVLGAAAAIIVLFK